MLGLGLANLINLFNPEMIIIGGELSDCRVYVEAARRAAAEGIFLHKANDVRIVTSQLGGDDLLKGAISLAMRKMFSTVIL
jgi:predicted NBD/HSP70 family sugar kinase